MDAHIESYKSPSLHMQYRILFAAFSIWSWNWALKKFNNFAMIYTDYNIQPSNWKYVWRACKRLERIINHMVLKDILANFNSCQHNMHFMAHALVMSALLMELWNLVVRNILSVWHMVWPENTHVCQYQQVKNTFITDCSVD